MKGSTFKRCGCKDEAGRPLNRRCPRLRGKHGSWFYVVELPLGADGKRRQQRRGGFATQRDAQEALDRVRDRLSQGQLVDDRQTTGAYLEEWLEGKRRLRPTTPGRTRPT